MKTERELTRNQASLPKLVVLLGSKVLEALGDTPYEILEAEGADFGEVDISDISLGWFPPHHVIRLETWFSDQVEAAINERASNEVVWDVVQVDIDLDLGEIHLCGVLEGAVIYDPDQDIEVPAEDDLDQRQIGQVLRDLGATDYTVRWKFGHSDWDDLSQISYDVQATWKFDPTALVHAVVNRVKAEAAIARGAAKYEAALQSSRSRKFVADKLKARLLR